MVHHRFDQREGDGCCIVKEWIGSGVDVGSTVIEHSCTRKCNPVNQHSSTVTRQRITVLEFLFRKWGTAGEA